MCSRRQFVDHFPSSFKLDYYESLNQRREKASLAFDVLIEKNVEERMLFSMRSGKYY